MQSRDQKIEVKSADGRVKRTLVKKAALNQAPKKKKREGEPTRRGRMQTR